MRNGFLAILGIGAAAIAIGGNARAGQATQAAKPHPITVKLEWASSVPRMTDGLTLVADPSRPATITENGRTVKVASTLNDDKTITVNLRITGPQTETFETEVTAKISETRVIQSIRRQNGKDSLERTLFVTADTLEE